LIEAPAHSPYRGLLLSEQADALSYFRKIVDCANVAGGVQPAGNGTLIPKGASCYSCHAAHAAVDTTFVQFYPTLLPIAQKKGTLSEAFVKEEAARPPSK